MTAHAAPFPGSAVRVLVDHRSPVVAAGTRVMLNAAAGFSVCPGFDDEDALDDEVDVVVTDVERGMQIARTAHAAGIRCGSRHVLVLATQPDEAAARLAFHAGVHGYVCVSIHGEELIDAVRRVAGGQRYGGQTHETSMPTAQPGASLTRRESAVLELISRGQCDKRIASALDIALPTVKTHVRNILAKLRVSSRTAAAVVAVQAIAMAGKPAGAT